MSNLMGIRLGQIRDSVQGVIDARKAYQEAMLKGASPQRLEELARIMAYVATLIPVEEVKNLVEALDEKRAA